MREAVVTWGHERGAREQEVGSCTRGPGEAPGGGGGRCYSSEPLGKRQLRAGTRTPRNPAGSSREGSGLGALGPGEPGHGNPGQKDLGREPRE